MTPTTGVGAPGLSGFPTRLASPPSRRCQNPWLTIAATAGPGRPSAAVKSRPIAGLTPSTVKRLITCAPAIRSEGSPGAAPRTAVLNVAKAASDSKDCASRCQSAKSAADTLLLLMPCSGLNAISRTRCSEPGYGSGRRSTALSALKMAVFAPMPSASVARIIAVETGAFEERAHGVPQILRERVIRPLASRGHLRAAAASIPERDRHGRAPVPPRRGRAGTPGSVRVLLDEVAADGIAFGSVRDDATQQPGGDARRRHGRSLSSGSRPRHMRSRVRCALRSAPIPRGVTR